MVSKAIKPDADEDVRLVRHECHWHRLLVGGRIVGKVSLFPTGGGWYLSDFMVFKRHRSRGFGHALMREILSLARRRQKRSIFLWVASNNVAAIRIYEAHGFECRIDAEGWKFCTLFRPKKRTGRANKRRGRRRTPLAFGQAVD